MLLAYNLQEIPANFTGIFPKIMLLKFMFSKKATKIDEIFNVDLTLCSKCHTPLVSDSEWQKTWA